jgi:MFS family permease
VSAYRARSFRAAGHRGNSFGEYGLTEAQSSDETQGSDEAQGSDRAQSSDVAGGAAVTAPERVRGIPGMRALLVAMAVDTVGSGLFLPISLLYFTAVSHLALATVGLLASAGALATLPVPLAAGALVDRYGARAVVLAGQLLQGLGFLAYLVVRGPAEVLLAILVVAVGQRAFWSSFFTMVAALPADSTTPGAPQERRFALVSVMQAAGYGVGALIGGLLAAAGTGAYRAVTLADGLTFLVSIALIVSAVPSGTAHRDPVAPKTGYRVLFRDRPYLALIAVNSIFCLCSVWMGVALPIYLVHGVNEPWLVGPLLALNTALLALGQTTVTRVMQPLARTRAVAVAGVLWVAWSAGFAVVADLPTALVVPYLVVVTMFYTFAEMIHAPASNALGAAAAPPEARGRYMAAFQYGFTFATIVAPVLFTSLFDYRPQAPWTVLAVLTALAAVAMPALGRALPADAVRAPAAGRAEEVVSAV